MYSRGICICVVMAQSWMTILLVFSQLFRGGCCAKRVLHVFSRVFLMLARQIVARVLSSISARVSMDQPTFAFSSYFIDESGAATEGVSIRVLSRTLAFWQTFIATSLLASAWILALMHFPIGFSTFSWTLNWSQFQSENNSLKK